MTKAIKLLNALPSPARAAHGAGPGGLLPGGRPDLRSGGRADRFWVIRSGAVSLTQQVTSLQRVTVASLGVGDLLGWSWLFPPYEWDFGAEAFSPVRAYEFEAASVLDLCERDPQLGIVLVRSVAEILAHRLESTRGRLMEHYALHGRGSL